MANVCGYMVTEWGIKPDNIMFSRSFLLASYVVVINRVGETTVQTNVQKYLANVGTETNSF